MMSLKSLSNKWLNLTRPADTEKSINDVEIINSVSIIELYEKIDIDTATLILAHRPFTSWKEFLIKVNPTRYEYRLIQTYFRPSGIAKPRKRMHINDASYEDFMLTVGLDRSIIPQLIKMKPIKMSMLIEFGRINYQILDANFIGGELYDVDWNPGCINYSNVYRHYLEFCGEKL